MIKTAISISILIVVLTIFIIFKRKKNEYELLEKEVLMFEDIIIWFKRNDISTLLKNKNMKAILLKGTEIDKFANLFDNNLRKKFKTHSNILIQSVYNTENNTLVYYRVILTTIISEELIKLFGDKEMLVIQ